MLEIVKLLILCGTLLALAFMVLLSLPASRLRNVLLELIGWAAAVFCGVYLISPVDLVPEIFLGPFGLIDDAGVVAGGVAAAMTALRARRERQELLK